MNNTSNFSISSCSIIIATDGVTAARVFQSWRKSPLLIVIQLVRTTSAAKVNTAREVEVFPSVLMTHLSQWQHPY